MQNNVSEVFDASQWKKIEEISIQRYYHHRAKNQGTVRVAFNRPECRNAFRPQTVDELYQALEHARTSSDVGCVLLTGNGPSPKDAGWAFCSVVIKECGKDGYQYADHNQNFDPAKLGRLHILEVQRLIRFMPKVVICVVPGWALVGGIVSTLFVI